MKSKAFLLHDGSYGCSYLIVWLMGEFISLLFTLYWILHFQEVYFGPSGTLCTWKDFRHNALEPFGHSHFANSVLWRRLSATSRRSVCNIDCGRQKGVWKYPYPVNAIHNTMSKRSLGFYTLLPIVECIVFFLHEDVVVLTRLTTRSPIVGCIHFCVWWIFSWIEAVWSPRLS